MGIHEYQLSYNGYKSWEEILGDSAEEFTVEIDGDEETGEGEGYYKYLALHVDGEIYQFNGPMKEDKKDNEPVEEAN